MLILADMPISKAAKLLRCSEKPPVKIMRYWVKKAADGTDLGSAASIASERLPYL